ncbi:MAG: transcriptional regulator [Geobacteraceae bacterium GWC2_53_11]|nr:MAG: transcriptional regulator [Geobacteraceae bacterium GWC2_53_11]
MHTRIISAEEALDLSSREESHFFDRKATAVSGKKIQKIGVAFANADGGEFVIGIADDDDEPNPELRWQGTDKIEDLNSQLQALFEIKPSLDLRYEILKCDEKPGLVLRIQIEKSSEVHQTADNTVYQRYGAQSLPIKDPQKITELTFAKGASTFEDQLLKEIPTEQITDSPELAAFLKDYSPKTDTLEFCINQNLLDYRTWEPRVASALLFHQYPSAVIPRKCALKISRYETKEDDPEREHLAEQVTIEGPLYKVIHDAIDAVRKIMGAVSIWTSGGLKNVEYPPEAVWEVLVNAVIHRDYSISDDTQVLIFDNRIEVLSPGRLPGYVTVDNILDARFSRNPKIVRTLNRYKDAPNKDLGEGLNTAFQKMKEWGLKNPDISEERGYVKVVLPHTPLAKPTELILNFLTNHESITNRQARDITGIKSENLVKVEFYKLKEEGFLERIPGLEGPKSAWQLTEAGIKESIKFK